MPVGGLLFNPQAVDALPLSKVYLAVLALACGAMVHYVACQRVKLRDAAGGEVYGAELEAGDTGSRLAGAASDSHAGFFDRLPAMVARDLVYLNVSGHYLNVVSRSRVASVWRAVRASDLEPASVSA